MNKLTNQNRYIPLKGILSNWHPLRKLLLSGGLLFLMAAKVAQEILQFIMTI